MEAAGGGDERGARGALYTSPDSIQAEGAQDAGLRMPRVTSILPHGAEKRVSGT